MPPGVTFVKHRVGRLASPVADVPAVLHGIKEMGNVNRLLSAIAAIAIVCVEDTAFAQSQATTAEVNGRVTDAQGAVLPGVTVTVTSPQRATREPW